MNVRIKLATLPYKSQNSDQAKCLLLEHGSIGYTLSYQTRTEQIESGGMYICMYSMYIRLLIITPYSLYIYQASNHHPTHRLL